MTMQNLAGALQTQVTGQAGAAGIDLLGQAADAYHAALLIKTKIDQPADWAMTQENLAVLEKNWSEHPACTDPLPHLRAGLVHVEAALSVYDPEHMAFYHEKAMCSGS
jgi:hypothetical protein